MHKDKAADGLRGLAAMNVVLCHFISTFYPLAFVNLYPGGPAPDAVPSKLDAIIGAPIISMLWNGNFAVCVFFVLSGYVLTKAYVETGVMESMQVRAARRYLRLCIPVCASVLFAYLVAVTGLNYANELSSATHSAGAKGFFIPHPSLHGALKEGLYRALFKGTSDYSPVLWTMKVEFIGSMLVFGFRALEPRGWSGWLTAAVLTRALLVMAPSQWPLYLGFIAGSYVGQLKPTRNKGIIALLLFVVALCGSFDNSKYYAFSKILNMDDIVRKNLFNIIGALALLYVVRAGVFSRLLQSGPLQFMGRISYSLYLVHVPILVSVGALTFINIRSAFNLPYWVGVVITLVVGISVAMCIAVLFERVVDRFAIRLSRKIYPGKGVEKDRGVTREVQPIL